MGEILWTLHYHSTVTTYLISLGESGTRLRRFIKLLQFDPQLNGWAIQKPNTNRYEICVEGHVVLYEIRDARKEIRILLVDPY